MLIESSFAGLLPQAAIVGSSSIGVSGKWTDARRSAAALFMPSLSWIDHFLMER
jgi:hypothetical protein